MYIELFLKITIAVLSVFGMYALVHLFDESFFRSDKIHMSVRVDSADVAEQIEMYLNEAKNAYLIGRKSKISVLIMENFATPELLLLLERKGIRYYIVK